MSGMDVPFNVDEWTLIPAHMAALAAMVGLLVKKPFPPIDFSLADVIVPGVLGQDWTIAFAVTVGTTVIAAVTYGWVNDFGDFDQVETAVVAIAAGLPIAHLYVPAVADWVGSSLMTQVAFVAVGGASMFFATVELESDGETEVPGLSEVLD